jgi:hypothetical protein
MTTEGEGAAVVVAVVAAVEGVEAGAAVEGEPKPVPAQLRLVISIAMMARCSRTP